MYPTKTTPPKNMSQPEKGWRKGPQVLDAIQPVNVDSLLLNIDQSNQWVYPLKPIKNGDFPQIYQFNPFKMVVFPQLCQLVSTINDDFPNLNDDFPIINGDLPQDTSPPHLQVHLRLPRTQRLTPCRLHPRRRVRSQISFGFGHSKLVDHSIQNGG